MNSHHAKHEREEDSDEEEVEDGPDALDQAQAHVLQLLYPVDGLEGPHGQHHVGEPFYGGCFPVEGREG